MLPFKKTNREAYTNFLRSKYEAYTGATTVRSYPYYLLIDPADICQLRCTTCPTGMDNEDRRSGSSGAPFRGTRSVMKPALFDALIEEAGPYLFFLMLYNWGEPLLNKSIHEFIKKANAYDIQTEIHTNLSLQLSERRIDELLSCGLDILTGSIDGFSQEAYQIHRVGGDIELIKKNLEALASARDRLGSNTQIIYKMLVFGHNEHEISAARQYAKDIGIGFTHEDAAVPDETWMSSARRKKLPKGFDKKMEGDPSQDPNSVSGGERVKDRDSNLAKTIDQPPAEEPVDLAKEQERLDILFPDKKGKDKFPNFCSWHYGYSVVTAGGPVAPCCSTAKESDDFGRVSPGEIRFADVWNNEKFRRARGALAGADLSETTGIKTICEPCRFPRFVQQLYSIYDTKVFAAFHRQFSQTEPALEAAFRLLSRTRYGLRVRRRLRRGIFDPKMLVTAGTGSERKTSAFVNFYEQYLADEPTALDASPHGLDRDPVA
jgi:MoaA/NifB/PqqE/SkfB family radical SAM enzyme